ncbi:hypothetical protein Dsin_029027 [Dipteronia sinensis]|uniref:DUF4283 domain-containing protein n=1 Tax=Dipteronia sinensis TaxID=43782 RepID=A0AAD9ZT60_9ROSI|nr:hypothetical protein Dsin_029027 [Dipteronia sinensis]
MVSPLLHGFTEDPKSLEASLSSSPQTRSTTASICCEGIVSSNSRGCSLGIVLPTTSSLGDNSVTVGDSIKGPVMNSNPLIMGSKSYADLLKAPQASVQSFPMTSSYSKKGGFVSVRVDLIAYESRLELCKDAFIVRVVLASGERPWKLVELKAKLSKHWLISADWRLISLGEDYFQIILKSSRDKNKHPKIIFDLTKGIGVPLRLDKATIDGDFGHYARVLVDIDMFALLPSLVLLERDKFHSSFILVEYENLPSFCFICSSIGHLPGSCHWKKSKVPTDSVGKSSQPMAEVSVEGTSFQPIPPRSSKMVYRPIDKTVQEIPVSNAFAAIYQDLGPIDSVVVHQSAVSGPSFISSSESYLINSSNDSHSGPSSTVVGLIPIPLSGVPYIQQVCNILPRKVPPRSSIVVSSGSYVMEAISFGIPSHSLGVGVLVASCDLTIQDDRCIVRDRINPSTDMRSESTLSNSQAELYFIANSSWAK